MNKCHFMIMQLTEMAIKQQDEEEDLYAEAQRMLNERLNNINWESMYYRIDDTIPTGDAALDESDEDEDYLIPEEEIIEDCPTTEEYPDISDDESILNVIDFTEEVNISDLYEMSHNDKYEK